MIDNTAMKGYLVQDKLYRSGFLNDATNKLENYLQKHGQKSVDLLGFNKGLRYNEGVLEEGESVAAMGKAKWKTKEEIDFDIPVDKILVITAYDEEPVYLTDEPYTTKVEYVKDTK